MEFLLNKLQTYKLQPSVLCVFEIQKIYKIRSNRFTAAVVALNNFSEKPQEGLQVYFKRTPHCMFY